MPLRRAGVLAGAAVLSLAAAAGARPATEAQVPPPSLSRGELAAIVRDAARGGRVQAAVAFPDGRVIAVASRGSAQRRVRMRSVAKAATAIALVETGPLPARTQGAMREALVRSDDCAQRHMTVVLQDRLGGVEPARRAVAAVLSRSGARRFAVTRRTSAGSCPAWVAGLPGAADPALQMGTSEWTVADAARFARSFGTAPGRVRALLRARKLRSPDVAGDVQWGAGRALARLRPAYKAGWGITPSRAFVVEQAVFVSGHGIGLTFEPHAFGTDDDPTRTGAPRAFAKVLRALRRELAL